MKKRNTKNKKRFKGAFHKNLEIITKKRIDSMIILDSDQKNHTIRLLQDPSTGFYVVFCGKYNNSCYCKSYHQAEKQYKNWVNAS